MDRTRHTEAGSLVEAVHGLLGDGVSLASVVDPSRHGGPDSTARALGIESEAFHQATNFYEAFASGHQADGPRWIAPVDGPLLRRLAEMAIERQGVHFLATREHRDKVPAHLHSLVKLEQPDGSRLLFRWQDCFVLDALAPLLSDGQRNALLGPVEWWLSVNACREELLLQRTSDRPSSAPLRLESIQLDRLSRAMLPFTVFRQADEVDSTLLGDLDECARLGRINPLLQRAQTHGLALDEDLSLYAVLALQLPPGFDESGPVARALERARTGSIGFGEAIDQVPIEEWRAWDEELDARGGFSD